MLLSPNSTKDHTQNLELQTVPHLMPDSEGVHPIERVSRALRSAGHLPPRAIDVFIHGSAVVIEGQVESYYQKQVTQEAVRKAYPHKSIRNELNVVTSVEDRLRR